jgi:hypothetical protein
MAIFVAESRRIGQQRRANAAGPKLAFVVAACKPVLHKYKEKEEARPRGQRPLCYVGGNPLIAPVLGNFRSRERRSVVVMDTRSVLSVLAAVATIS